LQSRHASYDKRDFEHASRDMNQAIKLNPNFSTAIADRGVAAADKLDYDRTVVGADPVIKAKPAYAAASAATARATGTGLRAIASFRTRVCRSATTSTTLMPIRRTRSRRRARH
jgi:hypothetical protein